MKLFGIISLVFGITDQLLHLSHTQDSTSATHKLQEKLCISEEGSIVQYCHRVWGIHEFSQSVKMHLNEMYKVHTDKHLSGSFPIENGLKQEDALSPLIFNFALV
jgi:hypothetical protein